MGRSVGNDVSNPVVDGDSGLLKFFGVRLCWGIELGAVTAIVAIACHAYLV